MKYKKALRKIPNRASNDFNNEPEFVYQQVKIIGEVKYYSGIEKYMVKDFSNNKFEAFKDDIIFIEEKGEIIDE